MRIGVDLMGSDSAPSVLFDAVVESCGKTSEDVSFVVFVAKEEASSLAAHFSERLSDPAIALRIDVCVVDQFVSMEDDPLSAIRSKKGSSLVQGVKKVEEGFLDAFVSSGNTGALIASCRLYLPPLPGFDTMALLAQVPAKDKLVAIVDVGGNVSSTPRHLFQYAMIGAAFQRCFQGVERPKVGLLNIGAESRKGTVHVRNTYQLLESYCQDPHSKIHFYGNVEGREVFEGVVDVLVTDGFTGNVLLKTSEGLSLFMIERMKQLMASSESSRVHAELNKQFSYEEYPGALVCGVDGIVFKCHGAATCKAMVNSILGACQLVKKHFRDKIKQELSLIREKSQEKRTPSEDW